MKQSLIFGICLLNILFAQAQPKTRTQLSGSITDAKTGEAIAGASVILSDSKSGTFTDSTGRFEFKNIPIGHTIIEVSSLGYKTIVEHIDILNNDVHNFTLQPSFLRNEGVTVTAVANATSIRKAPIPITKVTKSELLATPSANIIDALTRQPGISQLGTGPAISKPVIRGLGYNRLVVVNDGVRQEGQQWGDEHGIEIDENSVSRVEIVKGPASLIYGSDAIAGVVNIITTSPAPVNSLKANILSSYQSNNKQRSLFGSFGGNKHGWNWNAWADYKAAADYKNKYDGRVFNSKFNEHNYGGYAGYNGSWGFTHFIVSSFNQEVGVIEGDRDNNGNFTKALPGGVTAAANEDDFNSIDPHVPYQKINHLKFILDNSFKLSKGRISLNLGWQQNHRQEFGNADAPKTSDLFFDLQTFTYNTAFHFDDKKGWTTSAGISGMAQSNNNKAEEVLIPEYNLLDIGGFIYSQKTFGKTTLSGGARYDYRSIDSREFKEGNELKFTAFDKTFANISLSAGASYSATDNTVIKLNVARGFRAPSIPELSSNGAHEGTNRYEYGEQDLESERSLQADLGVETSSEHISASVNVFYNHISNFIFYSRLAGVNGGDSLVDVGGELIPAFKFGQQDANLYGGEFLIDLHPHPFDWLHWQNTFSYVRGKFASPVEGVDDLPLIPAARWISELRGELLQKGKLLQNLVIHFDVDHSFKQDNPFTAFGTETSTPSYTLLNAGISANIIRKDKTLFGVYFNAMNLGDVAYQSHLSRLKYTAVNPVTGRMGVFNMGRNFSFKVNVPLSF